jgi:hypothetical protein
VTVEKRYFGNEVQLTVKLGDYWQSARDFLVAVSEAIDEIVSEDVLTADVGISFDVDEYRGEYDVTVEVYGRRPVTKSEAAKRDKLAAEERVATAARLRKQLEDLEAGR